MPEGHIGVGQFRCFPLCDGGMEYPRAAPVPGRTEAAISEHLGPDALRPEITLGYSGFLVDTGGCVVLIDTGAGPLGPNTGRLAARIAACGFRPEPINLVVLSHLHPDHLDGLTRG